MSGLARGAVMAAAVAGALSCQRTSLPRADSRQASAETLAAEGSAEARRAPGSHHPHTVITIPGTDPLGATVGEQELVTVGTSSVTRAPLGAGLGQQVVQSPLSGVTPPNPPFATALYDGYVYVWGGYDPTTGNPSQIAISAPLSAGVLGAWGDANTSGQLFGSRQGEAGVIYDGYIYVLGGCGASSCTSDVSYAPLLGSGTIGSWQPTTPLPSITQYSSAVAYDGTLYAIGGQDSTGLVLSVVSAPINADGSVGAWTQAGTSPLYVFYAGAVAANGFLYVAGGYDQHGNQINSVSYAPIGARGVLGAWSTLPAWTNGLGPTSCVSAGGYLYALNYGGTDNFNVAQLLPDGTLGPWRTDHNLGITTDQVALFADSENLYGLGSSATAFSVVPLVFTANVQNSIGGAQPLTSLQHPAVVEYRGWLYVIGGIDQSTSQATAAIQEAQILPNGDISQWVTDPIALPSPRQGHIAAAHDGYLYVAGGCPDASCSSPLQTVGRAAIDVINGGLLDGGASTWVFPASWSFPAPARYDSASAVWNDTWYMLGGLNNAPVSIGNVDYAVFESDGGLSAWASTNALTSPLANFPAVAAQGYVYLSSGGSNTPLQNASILTSGLSAWSTVNSATPDTNFTALSTWNGDLIASIGGTFDVAPIGIDGVPGTFIRNYGSGASTAATFIDNGNLVDFDVNGQTVGAENLSNEGLPNPPQEIASLTSARSGHGMAFAGGFAYAAGGQVGSAAPDGGLFETYLSDVQAVPVTSTGTLPTFSGAGWSQVSSLPNARAGLGLVRWGNWLYAVGGIGSGGTSSEVDSAVLGADGGLGAFTATSSPLPSGRAFAWVGTYRNTLYVLGGTDGSDLTDVLLAPLNPDGSVGAWTKATVGLPVGRSHLIGAAYGGYLYAVGGESGGAVLDSTLVAPLGANGQPTGWKASASMADARRDAIGFALLGRLYAMGGSNGTTDLPDIVVAPITGAAGQLSGWYDTGAQLTQALSGLAGTLTDDGLVVWSGGRSSGVDEADSESITLSLTRARGTYSQLIDLGAPSEVSAMSLGGSTTLPGTLSLLYSAAPEQAPDGGPPAFGPEVTVGPVTPSASIPVGAANVRYLRLTAVLDDSDEVVVGPPIGATDGDALARSLTSISVTAFASDIAQIAFVPSPGQTVPAQSCSSAIQIQAEDVTGAAATVPAGGSLLVTVSGASIYTSAGCGGSPVSGISIPAGASSAPFYFEYPTQTPSITLTAQVTGLPVITQTEVISAPTLTASSSSGTVTTASTATASSSTGTTSTSGGTSASTTAAASSSTSTSSGSSGAATSTGSIGSTGSTSSGTSGASSQGAATNGSSGAACTTSIIQDANLSAVVGTDYLYNALGAIDVSGSTPAGITYSACGSAASVAGFVVFPTTGVVTWVPSAPGTVPLCVQISYGSGCTSTYEFSVTVVASSSAQSPVAALSASPLSIQVGQSVSFDGGGSQAGTGAQIVDYLWDFGDSSAVDPSLLTQSATSHTYQQPGGYVARLTVINNLGQQSTSPGVPISVGDAQCENPPSVLIVAPQLTGNVGFSETFSVMGTPGLSYLWDFGDGTESSSASPTHTFSMAGLYHIRLTGIDPSTGCTAQDAVQISVSNGSQQPPTCQFIADPSSGTLDASGQLAVTFRAVCFEAPSSGSNTAPTLTYLWSFDDDGSTSAQATVVHTYTEAGTFSPQVTVTDSAGLTNSDTLAETVLNSSGVAAPQILSSAGTSATCGQPYVYNSLDGNKLLVRAPAAITYSTGKQVAGATVGAPAGLSITAGGVVAWTPTAAEAGAQPVVLVASDMGGSAVQQFTVQVACTSMPTDGGTCADGGADCKAPAKGCGCSSGDTGLGGLVALLFLARGRRGRRED